MALCDTNFSSTFLLFFSPFFLFFLLMYLNWVSIVCQIVTGTKILFVPKEEERVIFGFLMQWLELPNRWDKNVFNLNNFPSAIVSGDSVDYYILETQKFCFLQFFQLENGSTFVDVCSITNHWYAMSRVLQEEWQTSTKSGIVCGCCVDSGIFGCLRVKPRELTYIFPGGRWASQFFN